MSVQIDLYNLLRLIKRQVSQGTTWLNNHGWEPLQLSRESSKSFKFEIQTHTDFGHYKTITFNCQCVLKLHIKQV